MLSESINYRKKFKDEINFSEYPRKLRNDIRSLISFLSMDQRDYTTADAKVFSPLEWNHSWVFLPCLYCSHIDLIIKAWSFQNQCVLIYLWEDHQVPRSPFRVQITLYGKGSCILIMKSWRRFSVGVFGKPLYIVYVAN